MLKKVGLLGVLVILLVTAGCPQAEDLYAVLDLTGKAYNAQSAGTSRESVRWILLPGGDLESASMSPYYVELDLLNKGKSQLRVIGMEAFVFGQGGDVLKIAIVGEKGLKPGAKTRFHVDTDGYAPWVIMSSQKQEPPPLTLIVSVALKSGGRLSYSAQLPSYPELRKHDSVNLTFSRAGTIPPVDKLRLKQKDEWPTTGPLKPPALMRQQSDELATYFYYVNQSTASTPRSSPLTQDRPDVQEAQPKRVAGSVGQQLVSGPIVLTVDKVELQPFINPMDRTGITIGMPQVYVTITFRNASAHPMTITSVRAAFMDNDQRNFTQTFTGEQALVLPSKKAQSLDFKTNGYALDPESATLSVTILHDKRLVAGPFDITIAQTLPSESREKEKKRREAIDAIDRRR